MNENRLRIFDIVKVSHVADVFVVVSVDDKAKTAVIVDHKGGMHKMSRSYVFKTGHSLYSLLDAKGYGHGLPEQPVPTIATTKYDEPRPHEPGDRADMEYGDIEIDPEVDAEIKRMEYEMHKDVLLSELSERQSNGAPKRKIQRTIRKLQKLTAEHGAQTAESN